jgi:hypothetical protein
MAGVTSPNLWPDGARDMHRLLHGLGDPDEATDPHAGH